MAAPKKIDYDRIEPGWRAGLLSPHQLAALYTEETGQKVSHAAIIKHFKKSGIARDLSSKINDRANAMVTEAMVTGKGPIPARTGQPCVALPSARLLAAYPRSHGATKPLEIDDPYWTGLSPLARGNPTQSQRGAIQRGPIPARTGQPLVHKPLT